MSRRLYSFLFSLVLSTCSAAPFLPIQPTGNPDQGLSVGQFISTSIQRRTISETYRKRNTRTWNAAAFVDPSDILSTIGDFYKNKPFVSAFVTCAIKSAAADWIAQTNVNQRTREGPAEHAPAPFRRKQTLAFFLYGGIYQGVGFELLYNVYFPKWFGNSVAKKVFADLAVFSPLATLPVAYLFKAAVLQYSFYKAMSDYKTDVMEKSLLTKFWILWIPIQTVCFSVVPQHYRVAFNAAISFFWMILFSTISSEK
jgi:hypothetical protein